MKTLNINILENIPHKFTGVDVYSDRSKIWYKDGNVHREDGPAVEDYDGYKEWWLEGKIYYRINLKDFIILDYSEGKYGILWYKLLDKNKVVDYPDIPGLIEK